MAIKNVKKHIMPRNLAGKTSKQAKHSRGIQQVPLINRPPKRKNGRK